MPLSLGDIEVLGSKPLGHGAFSVVKRCRLRSSGAIYALKVIDTTGLHEQDLANLKREIQLHRSFSHPNVIGFYDSFQEGKKVYILLELASNSSLFFYVDQQKGLPEHLALRFLWQTARGLGYLHSRGVIHRDVKPENVIFDAKFDAKICDFGWAALVKDHLEQRKSVCGTYEYMAPEIFYQKGHSAKADIWCLGILLYEMLYGLLNRETPLLSRQSPRHSI